MVIKISSEPKNQAILERLINVEDNYISDGHILFHKDYGIYDTPNAEFKFDELTEEMEKAPDPKISKELALLENPETTDNLNKLTLTDVSLGIYRLCLPEHQYHNQYTDSELNFVALNTKYHGYYDFERTDLFYDSELEGVLIKVNGTDGDYAFVGFLKVVKISKREENALQQLIKVAKAIQADCQN